MYSIALQGGPGADSKGLSAFGRVREYVALRNDVAAVIELRPNRCGRLCLSVLHQWRGGVLAAPTAQPCRPLEFMASVLYQCPTTGMNVQAWFDDIRLPTTA